MKRESYKAANTANAKARKVERAIARAPKEPAFEDRPKQPNGPPGAATFASKHKQRVLDAIKLAAALNGCETTAVGFTLTLVGGWQFEAKLQLPRRHYVGNSLYSPEHALQVLVKDVVNETGKLLAERAQLEARANALLAVAGDAPVGPYKGSRRV